MGDTVGEAVGFPDVGELVATATLAARFFPAEEPLGVLAGDGRTEAAVGTGVRSLEVLGAGATPRGAGAGAVATVVRGWRIANELTVGCRVGNGDGAPGTVPQKHPLPQVCRPRESKRSGRVGQGRAGGGLMCVHVGEGDNRLWLSGRDSNCQRTW